MGIVAVEPPSFLQLVGHPLRWRLLSELGASDRRVQELTAIVRQPQNLVSYHLGKLRRAGIVSSRRSSADGRDTYYRAELARVRRLLTEAGLALHPGLELRPVERVVEHAEPPRVLFLCTGNSARSQIAEALLEARSHGRVVARSAGSAPKPLHPLAVEVLRDAHGLDISDRESKHLSTFEDERFDRVITVCDRLREVCPAFPGAPTSAHWSVADPAADDGGRLAFERTAADLDERIGFLLGALIAPLPPRPEET